MVIRNGSIYWIDFSPGKGSKPKGRRPGVVIQDNALNDSKLNTSQMKSVDKSSLQQKIGTMSAKRLEEVQQGIKLTMGIV